MQIDCFLLLLPQKFICPAAGDTRALNMVPVSNTHLTIKAVEKGTGIANTTAKSLNLVVDSTKKVVTTVEKIASAAEWQAGSIAQITQGIGQISSVVQANSATAEESAAASEELSGQAQMLKSLVGQFRLSRAEGTDVPRHLPG